MGISERTEMLFGADGINNLSNAKVMVVGVGGVGSNCVLSLARSGIGTIVVVDYDVVSISNINRQAIAFHSTIGIPKIEVAKRLIEDINPEARVIAVNQKVLPDDVETLFEACEDIDYVIDCADTITTKIALAKHCEDAGIGYIAGMGSGNKYDPTKMEFSDIYNTRVCPVCKAVRKAARKAGLGKMLVVYSPEETIEMTASSDEDRRERRNVGTVSYYPAIMGQLLASHVIRSIANHSLHS